jgi:hypothetical protein
MSCFLMINRDFIVYYTIFIKQADPLIVLFEEMKN